MTAATIRNVNDGGEEVAVRNFDPLIVNVSPVKLGLPTIIVISGVTIPSTKRLDDGAERGADHDGHGQVDDVAAQDELAELLDHAINIRAARDQ